MNCSLTSLRFKTALHRAKPTATTAPASLAPSFSTTVHIKDVSHLTLASPDRIMASLSGHPIDVAQDAVLRATETKDLFLAKVWTTLVGFLEGGPSVVAGSARPLETLFVERLLPEL